MFSTISNWPAALISILLAATGPAHGDPQIDLPKIGESSGAVISPEQERELGKAFMREARSHLKIVRDSEVDDYIRALGYTISSRTEYNGGEFTFFVVQDPTINAFAAPGGYIGIHTGLITATRNEDELASVIAHEVAHVSQRHLPRALEAASKMNVPTTAALIAAILLGRSNPQIGEAAIATTLAGAQQTQINFTRSNELEADRIGIQLVARAGFDPRGMPAFFERLQQSYRFQTRNLPEFLSTHPVTTTRISDSLSRAEHYPPHKRSAPSEDYLLVKAKLKVLQAKTPGDLIRGFRTRLNRARGAEKTALKYGLALAALAASDLRTAEQYTRELLAAEPERVAFIALQARLDIRRRRDEKALQDLASALTLYPGQNTLVQLYAETLLRLGRQRDAYRVLKDKARSDPLNSSIRLLLARAARESGRAREAHLAMADYYYLEGLVKKSVDQLKIALRKTSTKSFYETSRIEARIAELEAEIKAMKESPY